MVDKQPVKIDYALVCDDIRQEDNGKLIIIGVYSGDIVLRDFPSTLNLSVLLHGQSSIDRSISLEIRYRAEFADAEPYEVTATANIQIGNTKHTNEFYVPLPRVPIQLRGLGELSITYRIDKKKWKQLSKKNIRAFES